MPYDSSLNFVFWSPTKVVFGENTALDVAIEVENLKCKKALIVTDRDLVTNTDIPERIKKALGNLCAGIFSDVEPDSGIHIVNQGAKFGAGRWGRLSRQCWRRQCDRYSEGDGHPYERGRETSGLCRVSGPHQAADPTHCDSNNCRDRKRSHLYCGDQRSSGGEKVALRGLQYPPQCCHPRSKNDGRIASKTDSGNRNGCDVPCHRSVTFLAEGAHCRWSGPSCDQAD